MANHTMKLQAKDRAMLRAIVAPDATCVTDMVELSRELVMDLLDDLDELEKQLARARGPQLRQDR